MEMSIADAVGLSAPAGFPLRGAATFQRAPVQRNEVRRLADGTSKFGPTTCVEDASIDRHGVFNMSAPARPLVVTSVPQPSNGRTSVRDTEARANG